MKRILRWVLAVFIGLAVTIFFLPELASIKMGKCLFLRLVGRRFQASLSADHVELSWLGPQKFSQLTLSHPHIDAKMDSLVIALPLWSISKIRLSDCICDLEGSVFLQNAVMEFHPPGGKETLFEHVYGKVSRYVSEFQVNLDFYVRSKTTANIGKCFVEGNFSSFCFENILENARTGSCDLQLHMERFPTHFFDFFFDPQEQLCKSICGNHLSLQGTLFLEKGEGEINCMVSSSHLQGNLNGKIENNTLFLHEPLEVEFFVDEAISRRYLQTMHPCFGSIISSRFPLKLQIENQGFSLPFDYRKIQVKEGRLQMGKFTCNNQGLLGQIVGLAKDASLFGASNMDVWFTPLEFSLQNGVIKTHRMDFLVADSLHFFTWGKIDILQNYIDMELGFDPSSLQGLSCSSQEDFFFYLPITGSLQHPMIGRKCEINALTLSLRDLQKENPQEKYAPKGPKLPWNKPRNSL